MWWTFWWIWIIIEGEWVHAEFIPCWCVWINRDSWWNEPADCPNILYLFYSLHYQPHHTLIYHFFPHLEVIRGHWKQAAGEYAIRTSSMLKILFFHQILDPLNYWLLFISHFHMLFGVISTQSINLSNFPMFSIQI